MRDKKLVPKGTLMRVVGGVNVYPGDDGIDSWKELGTLTANSNVIFLGAVFFDGDFHFWRVLSSVGTGWVLSTHLKKPRAQK